MISGGDASLLRSFLVIMELAQLKSYVEGWLKGTDCFLTDLTIGNDNDIKIEIDSVKSIDIEMCVALTRAIEAEFPRDEEDYDLEVGSAGLTSPLKVPAQYRKHISHDMEVLTNDGRKIHGVLTDADDEGFDLEWEQKVKVEGQKKPVIESVKEHFPYSSIKKACYDLKF